MAQTLQALKLRVGDIVAHKNYPNKRLGTVQEFQGDRIKVTNQTCLFRSSDLVVLPKSTRTITQFKVGDTVAYKTRPSKTLGRIAKLLGYRVELEGDKSLRITYFSKDLVVAKRTS